MLPETLAPTCSACDKDEPIGVDNLLVDCPTCDKTLCSSPCFSLHRAPRHQRAEEPTRWQAFIGRFRRA